MPDEFEKFGRTWQTLHPDWEMMLWTDDNLPPLHSRFSFDNSRSLAGKANVLRYEILLGLGGIYIDTDFECLKNLEPLLEGVDCFVARQRDEVINNAIIGAVPGHPFLRDLVDSVDDRVRSVPDEKPSVTQSGPYYLTKVVERHPEVTIFPYSLFYPYEWHERWRRTETFPNAYAVHHWTLSARSSERSKPRQLGDGSTPCLSVLLRKFQNDAGERLEWVLEGLCNQTVFDFEVIVVDGDAEAADLIRRFEDRLDIAKLKGNGHRKRNVRPTEVANLGLKLARSQRTLCLDADCVPDPDLVETHARFGGQRFVPFGFRRIYPDSKMYRFKQPLDYLALQRHSFQDPRRSPPFPPFYGDWRDLQGFCFSAPTTALREVGGFNTELEAGMDQDLAKRLMEQRYLLLPLWNQGMVTQLAPSGAGEVSLSQPEMQRTSFAAVQPLVAGASSYPQQTVEIVLDPTNRHFADETSPVAQFVRFGLWDNAYDGSGNIVNVAAEATNFVGADTRRFYFRVRDILASSQVDIKWRTLRADNTDDDRPTSEVLTLVETRTGSHVFTSKAVMLVTDRTDRSQTTNSGLNPPLDTGDRGPDQSNHRTRQGRMSGFVTGNYTPATGQTPISAKVPIFQRIPDERKRVQLKVINYGGSATAAYISGQFQHANDRWNQVAVQVDAGPTIVRAIPPGALNPSGQYPGGADSPQERIVLNDLIPITPDNTVTVVFVPLAGQNAYTTIAQRTTVNLQDRFFVFVDTTLDLNDETLAHELHHVLFNRFDAGGVPQRYFTFNTMPPNSFGIPLPDDRVYRRIQNQNSPDPDNDPTNANIINWARRTRTSRFPIAPADLSAATPSTGNTLLTPF